MALHVIGQAPNRSLRILNPPSPLSRYLPVNAPQGSTGETQGQGRRRPLIFLPAKVPCYKNLRLNRTHVSLTSTHVHHCVNGSMSQITWPHLDFRLHGLFVIVSNLFSPERRYYYVTFIRLTKCINSYHLVAVFLHAVFCLPVFFHVTALYRCTFNRPRETTPTEINRTGENCMKMCVILLFYNFTT